MPDVKNCIISAYMLGEYFDDFLQYLATMGRSRRTIEAYEMDLREFLSFLDDRSPSVSTVRAFFRYLFEKGYSERTIRRKRSAISSFFKYLMRIGVVKDNPITVIPAPRLPRTLPKVIPEKELNEILDRWVPSSLKELRDKAIVELLYSSGLRASEIGRLRVSDIDFERMEVRVFGKGNREAIVPVGRRAIDVLREYVERAGLRGDDYLFTSRKGDPISRTVVWYIVRRSFEKIAALSSVHPHLLRHSFATHMLNRGADIRTVQALLRHKTLKTTQIYTHVSLRKMREAYNRFHPRNRAGGGD